MADIVVYLTKTCPYCIRAKHLLKELGASYAERLIDSDPDLHQEMIQRSKQFTVPQIFINDVHIGGFDDLNALHLNNELEPLLR